MKRLKFVLFQQTAEFFSHRMESDDLGIAGLAFGSTGHHRPQSAFLFAHRPMFCFAGKRGQCKAIVCETASRELSKDTWFCVAWQ